MGDAWPKTFKVWHSGDGAWSALGCYFNSSLSTKAVTPGQNAALTIYLRLMLVERNVRDARLILKKGVPSPIPLRDWAPGEFIEYKNAVKTKAEAFWNNKITLVNAVDASTLDVRFGDKIVRPNIDCKLEIVFTDSAGDSHQIINCFSPLNQEDMSCFVKPSSEGNGTGQFRNNLVEITPRNVNSPSTCLVPSGDPLASSTMTRVPCVKQIPIDHLGVAHEIGHLLGMPHVGVARRTHDCMQALAADPSDGKNSNACYAGEGPDIMNIMGVGTDIAGWNAGPWRHRMFHHTGIGPHAWVATPNSRRTEIAPKVLNA